MADFESSIGYRPGIIGKISQLHAMYYSVHWNFGHFFEAKVATELSNFINKYNNNNDRIWSLSIDDNIEGSITINGTCKNKNIAHLRWFIISDKLKGKGAGNYLMEQAISFCREQGFEKVYLWTFDGLGPARHLYEKFGFKLVEERSGEQWGATVTEQRFELKLDTKFYQ
jgi:N-acetylglutamate synthase-like GNAT family acetyltransferase